MGDARQTSNSSTTASPLVTNLTVTPYEEITENKQASYRVSFTESRKALVEMRLLVGNWGSEIADLYVSVVDTLSGMVAWTLIPTRILNSTTFVDEEYDGASYAVFPGSEANVILVNLTLTITNPQLRLLPILSSRERTTSQPSVTRFNGSNPDVVDAIYGAWAFFGANTHNGYACDQEDHDDGVKFDPDCFPTRKDTESVATDLPGSGGGKWVRIEYARNSSDHYIIGDIVVAAESIAARNTIRLKAKNTDVLFGVITGSALASLLIMFALTNRFGMSMTST
jgi:hypothetical protein